MEASELNEVMRVAHLEAVSTRPECAECEELLLGRRQCYCSVLGCSPPLPEVRGILLRSERPTPHVRVPESPHREWRFLMWL